VLELDDARPVGDGGRVLGIGLLLLFVEQLEDALGRGRSGLHDRSHAAQLAERLGELLRVLDEGLHVAEAQLPDATMRPPSTAMPT
jgi:hypothetical protein